MFPAGAGMNRGAKVAIKTEENVPRGSGDEPARLPAGLP